MNSTEAKTTQENGGASESPKASGANAAAVAAAAPTAAASEPLDTNMILSLPPEEIKIKKELAVRKFADSQSPETEKEAIERMAITMIDEGQLQPVVVSDDGKGGFFLIAGHRRRAAAALINSGGVKSKYDPAKKGPFLLDCRVREIEPGDDLKRIARLENTQRKNFSAMDLALNIADVVESNGWGNAPDWSKKVAEYMGLNRTTVSQHRKLLTLDKSIQKQVHAEEITVNAALTLVSDKIAPEKREDVAREAKKLAAEEKSLKDKAAKKKAAPSTKPAPVQKKHVVAAARAKSAIDKSKRSQKEICSFFDELTGPAYAKPMQSFAEYFGKWAAGEGSDSALTAKWNQIDSLVCEALEKTTTKPAGKSKKSKAA